jgi:hypothetical protein
MAILSGNILLKVCCSGKARLRTLGLAMSRTLKLAAALVVLAGLAAAQTRVTVADTLLSATGARESGHFTIRAAAAFTAPDGSRVDTAAVTVQVVNGAFSVALWPGTYTVAWTITYAPQRTETWLVPAGSSAVNLAAVVTTTVQPSWLVLLSQILAPGTAAGNYCISVAANGAVTLSQAGCPGSGGTGGLMSMTNTQLAALLDVQLLGLAN